MVACGVWHTATVACDTFDVYTWGWNKFGQCGARTRPPGAFPTTIHGKYDVTKKIWIEIYIRIEIVIENVTLGIIKINDVYLFWTCDDDDDDDDDDIRKKYFY